MPTATETGARKTRRDELALACDAARAMLDSAEAEARVYGKKWKVPDRVLAAIHVARRDLQLAEEVFREFEARNRIGGRP